MNNKINKIEIEGGKILEQWLNEIFREHTGNVNTKSNVTPSTKSVNFEERIQHLEKRVAVLEECINIIEKSLAKQDDINADLIEIANILVDRVGGKCCDKTNCVTKKDSKIETKKTPEVGKWYLVWNDNKSEAVVATFVGIEDGKMEFAYSSYDAKENNTDVYENYEVIQKEKLGVVGKKNQVGKLYFVYDDNKSHGTIVYACSSKEFCNSVSEMNDIYCRYTWRHVEEINPSTLGK